ncbi:recombinase family protein [Frankia sp. Ag45/Mut15]|uniref:Recombinase family protein n=1 Tax=Frankia umida TaxID=573489 RepID=A0ABT0JYL7_9ACTN|nr:recombinase family protein [Frankia umida]MCK9876626.1 recombinase family protein [Frankia umida]
MKMDQSGILRAIGYMRVSTDEQGDSGAGLAAQRAVVEAECARRGWTLVEVIEDVASGKTLDRPGMTRALGLLDARQADVLIAAKVDRISRSTLDFATLLDRAQRSRWALNVLDIGADLTTPAGEMFAQIVAVIAQYERRLIGQRTRDALAIRKAAGVQLGTVFRIPGEVVFRIAADYAAGAGLTAIARNLTAEGIPTARGGTEWRASTVQAVIRRVAENTADHE